jgi:hypothetical protein
MNRPNLMDLTPLEFENLIGILFSRWDYNSERTRQNAIVCGRAAADIAVNFNQQRILWHSRLNIN